MWLVCSFFRFAFICPQRSVKKRPNKFTMFFFKCFCPTFGMSAVQAMDISPWNRGPRWPCILGVYSVVSCMLRLYSLVDSLRFSFECWRSVLARVSSVGALTQCALVALQNS